MRRRLASALRIVARRLDPPKPIRVVVTVSANIDTRAVYDAINRGLEAGSQE